MIRKSLVSRYGIALVAVLAALPAQAAASTVHTAACSNPLLSRPFLAYGDANWYTPVPGQSANSFDGTGWQLTGGAKFVTSPLADGSTGLVLDLPSGSKAVSPTLCVTSAYPTVRTLVRNRVGAEGVFVHVSYEGTNTWTRPKNTGQVHGQHTDWTLSDPVNVQPSNLGGRQPMRFTLIPGGKTSDFEIYDLYVDPHMSH